MLFANAKPNEAHLLFAELEGKGKRVSVVMQNIDGLHFDAGSKEVYEIHGSVRRNFCLSCGNKYGIEAITNSVGVLHCDCGGIIKPDVVLYEEMLNDDVVSGAVKAIAAADCLIIIGTSLIVYPAAGFINYFHGENLIIINKERTSADAKATLTFYDDVINVVKRLKEKM